MNRQETHIISGITRDVSPLQMKATLAVDARNIRITARGTSGTLMSVTNEKGPAECSVSGDTMKGTAIGTAAFSDVLIVFTTSEDATPDRIYRLDFSEDYSTAECSTLFEGSLGFDIRYPIETIPFVETETVRKVYWVDGINQPRMVNIENGKQTNPDIFNFVRQFTTELSNGGKTTMTVTKNASGGQFPAGTVQYCFTYFDKFGQQTAVAGRSALYYLSPVDRGLPADGTSVNSFNIDIENLDSTFEYVRLYAIVRTSEGATPNVRILGDFAISDLYSEDDTLPSSTVLSTTDSITLGETSNPVVKDSNGVTLYTVLDKLAELSTDGLIAMGLTLELEEGQYLYDASVGYIKSEDNKYVVKRTQKRNSRARATYGWYVYPVSGTFTVYGYTGIAKLHTVDTGQYGSTLDSTYLSSLLGNAIIAGTISMKDNTLFLGNIQNITQNIGDLACPTEWNTLHNVPFRTKPLKEYVKELSVSSCYFGYDGTPDTDYPLTTNAVNEQTDGTSGESFYDYDINNVRSSQQVKTFKYGENYRLGFVAQNAQGEWSEVLWIGDHTEENKPVRMAWHYSSGGVSHMMAPVRRYDNVGFKATLSEDALYTLRNAGFKRVAPVVVYPRDSDRYVLAQGLLAGTVFNVSDRISNSPFVQADWRFRTGYSFKAIREEIQCNSWEDYPDYPGMRYASEGSTSVDTTTSSKTFTSYFREAFYRDPMILTFHSPDIECSDDVSSADFTDVKMRIVGMSTLDYSMTDDEWTVPEYTPAAILSTSSLGYGDDADIMLPMYSNLAKQHDSTRLSALSWPGYSDYAVKYDSTGNLVKVNNSSLSPLRWRTYLWHRNGSLNNQASLTTLAKSAGVSRTALLKRKCISELRYSRTFYLEDDIDITCGKAVLVTPEDKMVQIDLGTFGKVTYYSEIDKVLTPNTVDFMDFYDLVDANTKNREITSLAVKFRGYNYADYNTIKNKEVRKDPVEITYNDTTKKVGTKYFGYPIEAYNETSASQLGLLGNDSEDTDNSAYINYKNAYRYYQKTTQTECDDNVTRSHPVYSDFTFGKDPVYMRYKTGKHLVIPLIDGDTVYHLDSTAQSLLGLSLGYMYWVDDFNQDSSQISWTCPVAGRDTDNVVYIAELYREFTDTQKAARYGGTSQSALAANDWLICGDIVDIPDSGSADLYFKEGDTYCMRYDCLKSYPYSQEDPNSIVSIFSTDIETRVNLDERYDRNRGLKDNTLVTPQNFGLISTETYDQTNQYFVYHAADYDTIKSQKFPQRIEWSQLKTNGEDIDTFTVSQYAQSFIDLDGDKGELTALRTHNDSIYAFQKKGLSQVLFNSRVQIPTSDNNPIEITNGYKVSGIRYISDKIGVTNKWGICSARTGLHFIDDNANAIYRLSSDGLSDLSVSNGFFTWLTGKNSYTPWNPSDFSGIRTFYDTLYGDIYFMSDTESLVYSEITQTFTSFMDYSKLDSMVNMGDRLFILKDSEDSLGLYEMWKGDYNMFFGEYKPYWLTIVSNTDPSVTKTFNNLEWHNTMYSPEGEYLPFDTFDTVRVWHNHQDTGDVKLEYKATGLSSLKKKWNTFRCYVPRDVKDGWNPTSGKEIQRLHNDRIKNTWTYVKLGKYTENKDRIMFTDMQVSFFE